MEEKSSYLQKLAAQLQEWDVEIDQLKAKAEKATADAKAELTKQINELSAQRQTAQSRFTELQAAGDEAWEEIKSGLDQSWTQLKGAFKSAWSKFDKQ